MLIIPAIDIKEGRCVRLNQGKRKEETVYSDDPVAMGIRWQEMGVGLLHVVDLDGAWAGNPENFSLIRRLVESLDISLEVGGGIRSLSTVEQYLGLGVEAVVLGTAAVTDSLLVKECCRNFPGRIVLGLDVQKGYLAIQGWETVSTIKATEIIRQFEGVGLRAAIFTDIQRDGMLAGPNFFALQQLLQITEIPVIASGGITSLEDVKALLSLKEEGLQGMIIGKALYSGKLNLREVLEIA